MPSSFTTETSENHVFIKFDQGDCFKVQLPAYVSKSDSLTPAQEVAFNSERYNIRSRIHTALCVLRNEAAMGDENVLKIQ